MTSDIPNNLQNMVDPDPIVAGFPLRPFTGGSLILLQKAKNSLINTQVGSADLFFDIASFIYIHTEDIKTVRRALLNWDEYQIKVMEFADKINIPDLIQAASEIRVIIEKAAAGLNYQVQSDGKEPDPNS